ncbi:MAG: hypothetical protein JST31_13725 [Actinobacteria bacterium]|nr:hypothetical protein [Actinomycetota bacterium]
MAEMEPEDWVRMFCERLGVEEPPPHEVEELLSIAATAAHDSQRLAAPIATWAAGRSGRPAAELREIAEEIAAG